MEIRKQVNRFFFYIGVSQPAIAEACTERSNVTLDFKTVYFDEKKSIQKSASRVSAWRSDYCDMDFFNCNTSLFEFSVAGACRDSVWHAHMNVA